MTNNQFFGRAMFSIAKSTYLEARHNRVLHLASLFAIILILFSLFLGEVSLFQNEKIVKDIGLASISLLGIFVAIFLGVNSLYKELERRTIYSIISKPITRTEIIFGKFLGMLTVIGSIVLMMTIFLYLVTAFLESSVDISLMPAIGLIFFELVIVAAISVFYSSFSSPFLSAFFATGTIIVGRVARDLGDFGERSKNPVFKFFATSVQKVFDLEAFNLRTVAVHKLPIYYSDFWLPVAYSLIAATLLLVISNWIFSRRDFK